MEIKNYSDIGVNRTTLKKLLKDTIEFINEHESDGTRCGLLEQVIIIIADEIKLTPSNIYGLLEGTKFQINENVLFQAREEARKLHDAFKKTSKE